MHKSSRNTALRIADGLEVQLCRLTEIKTGSAHTQDETQQLHDVHEELKALAKRLRKIAEAKP